MIGAGNEKQVGLKKHRSGGNTASQLQFRILADKILRIPDLASDPRFNSNSSRVENRDLLKRIITDVLITQDKAHWLREFTGLG